MNPFSKTRKRYQTNEKAEFMSAHDLNAYRSDFLGNDYFNNTLLSQQFSLPQHSNLGINNNILLFGNEESVDQCFVKPNILQMNASFVFIDHGDRNGQLLKDVGKTLHHHGYKIKVLDTTGMRATHRYNPFHYCKTQHDVELLADSIIANTPAPGRQSDYDDQIEKLLLCSCICYLVESVPWERDFTDLCRIFREAIQSKEDRDKLYDRLKNTPENSLAHRYFNTFKDGAMFDGTDSLLRCQCRLHWFLHGNVKYFGVDEMELESLRKEKNCTVCHCRRKRRRKGCNKHSGNIYAVHSNL